MAPLLGLAACDGGPIWRGEARTQADAAAGYLAPPKVLAIRPAKSGVALAGSAAPGARVRLGSPTGEAFFAVADATGRWSIVAPGAADVRLYGLSMSVGKRSVQSEGYLAVTPEGRAAQLRAAGGTYVLAPASRRPVILALDFDRDGAAMISGVGTPQAEIGLRIDRTAYGGADIDRQGRYSFALSRPLAPGVHAFEISAEGGEDLLTATIQRPTPLDRPFVASRQDGAWRIDWMTPGGGVQTTLLFDPDGPAG